jgi:hypothetical protein
VYNEPKTIMYEQHITPELTKLFGEKLKIYVRASYKRGLLKIGPAVKSQSW